MIILFIPDPEIPTDLGWTHDATDWVISTDPAFNDADILTNSLSDTVNLTSITFDIDLQPDVTYYARARVICNKGIFEWSNINIVKVEDFINIAFEYDIPSVVIKPEITLDFPNDNTPNTMFTIKTNDINTTSNAKHLKTSYIIEDLNGRVYLSDTNNEEELTSKLMDDVILEEGKVYLLKVAHVSTSRDVSDYAVMPFYVKPYPSIVMKSSNTVLITESDFNFTIAYIELFQSMDIEVYATGYGDAKLVDSGTSNTLTYPIPSSVFAERSIDYLIAVTVTLTNDVVLGKKYFKLSRV